MDAGTSISLRSDVIEKLKNALNDSSYRETIESSSNYNNRLVVERKTRIPFIDSQTGVAQNDCYLWMQKWERMPGITEGQLYSYPKKRWRKKKRSQYLLNSNYGLNVKQWEKNPDKTSVELTNGHETTTHENNLIGLEGSHHEPTEKYFETVALKDEWMNELEDVADFNDTLDMNDEPESDYDDEEYSSRKKKKKKNELGNSTKKGKKSSSNQSSAAESGSSDKPYKCDLCNMRYKTRPGLSYHYSHTHSVDVGDRKHLSLDEDDSQQSMNSLTGAANGLNSRSSQISNSTSNSPLPPSSFNQTNSTSKTNSATVANQPVNQPAAVVNKSSNNDKSKKPTTPSSYCDFCLGNSEINKKTRTSEEMISCHHCGRSAHPTCLQFTPNMLKSVKKYPWECLECKSCGICGTSDNDDQLLFCDDCDRGYHSHCVGLKEIPEGEWSCSLCIVEYHSNDKSKSNSATNEPPISTIKSAAPTIESSPSSLNNNNNNNTNNTNNNNLSNSSNTNSTNANNNNSNNKTSSNSHSNSKSPSLSSSTTTTTIATSIESTVATDKS